MKSPSKISITSKQCDADDQEILELIKSASDNLTDGLVIFEKSPVKIIYANPAAGVIMGRDSEELLTMSDDELESLIHKEDHMIVKSHLKFKGQEENYTSFFEHRLHHSDGREVWIDCHSIEFQKDKKPYGIFLFSDITERKKREDEILQREERYRLLYENLSDALFITDIHGNITMCNWQATHLFGYSQEELQGMNFIQLVHPDEREDIMNAFRQSLERKETREEGIIVRILRKDGHSFYYHVTSSLILHKGNAIGYQSLIRDITESKLNEIRLTNSMKDLQLYSSFLKHDIRHELQLIATSAGILSQNAEDGKPQSANYEVIRNSVSRITDILNFMNTEDAASSTDDIIENLEASALRAMRQHEGLKIILEVNPSLRDISLPRGALIGLVFNNLFQNAAIHAGESAVVRVSVRVQDRKLIMDFMDDGPGVDVSIRGALFRKGTSTSGTGLGLYLSRRVIEEYNGYIELIDEKRKGATFRISLPLAI